MFEPPGLLLPPPLRGRGGEGGPRRRSEFGAPPSPTPPRKGEGGGEGPRKAGGSIQREGRGRLPPAGCLRWHFPPAPRAIAAMAASRSPMGVAPRRTRHPHRRAR